MSTTSAPREQWASRYGFILAAVGSAVGLGNMWRFPYLTAENGGAAFLILYILLVALVGLPIMLAEFVVGRGSKRSPIEALVHFGGNRWRPLGAFYVLIGFLILSYYAVIAGWVVRYTAEAAVVGFPLDPGAHFEQVATGWGAVLLHLLFIGLTIFIVRGGVKGGIERAVVLLMPVLFLIVLGLAVYAATLPGAGWGYSFYLQTDFGELLSLGVLNDAAGQAFFSLSLGMGALLTYASYLSRDDNLPQESVIIAASDFAVAFFAGLMVFPIIFALGLSEAVGESTIGALFISLPEAFSQLGGTGRVVGFLFFAALLVGALTSAISLLEVVVSSVMDTLGWTRARAALAFGGAIALAGIPSALDLTVLGLLDQVVGNVFLVLGALLIALFVGWRVPDPIAEARKGAGDLAWLPLWRSFLRWVVPAFLLFVFFYAVQDTVREIAGLVTG